MLLSFLFFSSRRRHTSCALVTGVQTCALPICKLIAVTEARAKRLEQSHICRTSCQIQLPTRSLQCLTLARIGRGNHPGAAHSESGQGRGQENGSASCRARVGQYVSISGVGVRLKKKKTQNK